MPAALVAGAALSPGTISADVGKTLATFLGLVSASVLPTISLLINSMTASGRSVKAIDDLQVELQAAMDALFLMFGCVAVVIGGLVALTIDPPTILVNIPYITTQILPRTGQAIVVLFSSIILLRIGQIPAILRRSLAVRHRIAVEEARRKTLERAPKPAAVRGSFETHPDFGKTVTLDELPNRDVH